MRFASPCRCGVLLLLFAQTGTIAIAGEPLFPLESAVKVFRAPAPVATPAPIQTGVRPAPAPSTPAAKLPQYQIGHPGHEQPKVDNATNPAIRFFLNLPNEVLLVEAKMTIDDRPFGMIRQKRAEKILKEVKVGKDITTGLGNDPNQPAPTIVVTEPLAASSVADRLRHTMQISGETPTLKEVDWLISQWIDGPTILPLNSNFQKFRANQRPEFVILDRNRDGIISGEEMQLADKSLWDCDLNQDGIIQFMEIAVAATDPRTNAAESDSGDLIVFLPGGDCGAEVSRRLGRTTSPAADASPSPAVRFDTNSNGQLDAEEIETLHKRLPDLSLTISFNTTNPEKSRLAITNTDEEVKASMEQVAVDTTGITLTLKGTPLILNAVQLQPSDQISIGAVNDGYPLLPALDLNDDGRLTIRELRALLNTLKSFDRNHDGSLTLDEVQSPIRLCIGLGASVHRELIGIRSVHQKTTLPPTTGPEWFVRMDRNKDNDLTRSEFPGTDEQFQILDADHDQLVSADEALQFDKQIENGKQNENPPATN